MSETNMNICLVEDEKDIRELIAAQLENNGLQVTKLAHGEEALEVIQTDQTKFDLFILDRMLPGTSGIEICKFLRFYKQTKHTPILMVTALTRPEQIIEGLDAGADDYITKPFDMKILMARVRALLRRNSLLQKVEKTPSSEEEGIFKRGNIKIDTNQCKVWLDEEIIELTLSEYKLLCALMKGTGKVLTRKQLVETIQEGPVHVTERTIDTHIFGLRKKLKENSNMIETIRGIGYRISGHD